MRPGVTVVVALFVNAVALTSGCGFIPNPPPMTTGAGGVGGTVGAPIDAACTKDGDCRDGLACPVATKTCQPASNKAADVPCVLSAECVTGLYCGPAGKCAPSGKMPEGGVCSAEGDCTSGLVCLTNGQVGACVKPGTGDVGKACMALTDCRAGLLCAAGSCQALVTGQFWTGAKCDVESEGAAKLYFKVPRAGEPPSDDFYRLPFPNDIRKKNGRISLAGHPTPGASLLPFDPVDRYIKAIEEDSTGFGLNQAVYFRFSGKLDLASLHKDGAVAIWNITPGSPEYARKLGQSWSATTAGGRYICPRYVVVRHPLGSPLRPATTYAVVLKNLVVDDMGKPVAADDDFKAMLAAASPADPDMAAAWKAYAPLRAYITANKLNAEELTGAAVFTTEDVEAPLVKLRAAVRAAPTPEIKGFMRCGDAGKTSPCEDGKTGKDHVRGCMVADSRFDEYQGTIGIPIFQKGTPPYEQPADGGGIDFVGDAPPKIQRTDDVCFAVTVPKGAAPAAGWPTLVYAHGTGGGFRSHMEAGLAGEFATGETPGGAAVPTVTLGYDGVLHGTRRGASTKAPSELVFNVLNPRAARDNALQSAVDLFAIARAIETFSAGGLKLDKTKVALYGHSQGANAASIAIGREPAFGEVVLSGSGGTLFLSFLYRKNPVDIAAGLPLLLADPVVDGNHPVLSLVQMFFERSDPVNYARRIFAEPAMGVPAHHFLHIYGTGDTYAPIETQRTLALAASLPVAMPVVDNYQPQTPPVSSPVKTNFTTTSPPVTAVQAQYNPGMYDGHFVSTENPAARKALRQMIGTFFRDGTPTVQP